MEKQKDSDLVRKFVNAKKNAGAKLRYRNQPPEQIAIRQAREQRKKKEKNGPPRTKTIKDDLLHFHKKQRLSNVTRMGSTKLVILYMQDKINEDDCKAHRDCLEELRNRLDTLQNWVTYDTDKIVYYEFQINGIYATNPLQATK